MPLHWAGVHAGILSNDPAAVAPTRTGSDGCRGHSPFAKGTSGAGGTWLRGFSPIRWDPDEVTAAARAHRIRPDIRCHPPGQPGRSADPDAKVPALMLQVARDPKVSVPDITVDSPPRATRRARPRTRHRPSPSGEGQGSPRPQPWRRCPEREREVAELLLLGMPYRDIGAQLFISAKTVEHHVARIRRRPGLSRGPRDAVDAARNPSPPTARRAASAHQLGIPRRQTTPEMPG